MSNPAQAHSPERHQTNTGAVIRITTVAAFGGLLFGYDSAVINGAVSSCLLYTSPSPRDS